MHKISCVLQCSYKKSDKPKSRIEFTTNEVQNLILHMLLTNKQARERHKSYENTNKLERKIYTKKAKLGIQNSSRSNTRPTDQVKTKKDQHTNHIPKVQN